MYISWGTGLEKSKFWQNLVNLYNFYENGREKILFWKCRLRVNSKHIFRSIRKAKELYQKLISVFFGHFLEALIQNRHALVSRKIRKSKSIYRFSQGSHNLTVFARDSPVLRFGWLRILNPGSAFRRFRMLDFSCKSHERLVVGKVQSKMSNAAFLNSALSDTLERWFKVFVKPSTTEIVHVQVPVVN